jgi:hypothetical protein
MSDSATHESDVVTQLAKLAAAQDTATVMESWATSITREV